MRWSALATSGSKLLAVASGIGKIVRKPWIVSNANRIGMPSREFLDRGALVLVDQHRVGFAEDRADRLLASAGFAPFI